MRSILLYAVLLIAFTVNCASAQRPTLKNISVRKGAAGMLHIQYELTAGLQDSIHVILKIKHTDDPNRQLQAGEITGDIGFPVFAGAKEITWSYPDSLSPEKYVLQLIAYDDQPVDIAALLSTVSEEDVYQTLSSIAGARNHRTSAAHKHAVKEMIQQSFTADDIHPELQTFSQYQNVIGRKSGALNDSVVYVIDAHYDSVADSPGADDNGSGVAAVVTAAELLKNELFGKSIYFIAFDGEEDGLLGSISFLNAGRKSYDQIRGVLNLEMIGYASDAANSQQIPAGFEILFPQATAEINANDRKGNFIINTANDGSVQLKNDFAASAAAFVPELKVISLQTPGKGEFTPDLRRSDHAPFWEAGIPALMLTDGANYRNPHYHTPGDSLGTINKTFMHRVTLATIATLIQLAEPLNGSSQIIDLSGINTVKKKVQKLKMGLYPQPADKYFIIELPAGMNGAYHYAIEDMQGKTIRQGETQLRAGKSDQIDTQHLPPGRYLITLFTGTMILSEVFIVI